MGHMTLLVVTLIISFIVRQLDHKPYDLTNNILYVSSYDPYVIRLYDRTKNDHMGHMTLLVVTSVILFMCQSVRS
ncbi:hypothetical protein HanIR_Chr03g0141341 [Helianthus annuus]|nr:hypothetical protein HanIR_Chr03g0141341 [Helianthus annuus]